MRVMKKKMMRVTQMRPKLKANTKFKQTNKRNMPTTTKILRRAAKCVSTFKRLKRASVSSVKKFLATKNYLMQTRRTKKLTSLKEKIVRSILIVAMKSLTSRRLKLNEPQKRRRNFYPRKLKLALR